MGRRRNKRNQPLLYDTEMYWQSAGYNNRLFTMYRNQIIAMALNRFKWVGLPKTCNERYLEYTLLFQGLATIAFPRRQRGIFYSTQVAQMSAPNIYDNPVRWQSIGNNGWRFSCTAKNGVIVWENKMRFPIMERINLWARELVDVTRTKQINRMHAKTPFIIKCLQEQEQQAANLFKQIAGFEPAIITTTGVESIDVDAIKTDVPFLGSELTAEEVNVWNRIYQALGIPNLTFKSERMIQDEVQTQSEPTSLIALDSLTCRREACDILNDKFAHYLDEPIRVVWRQDNESDNYNFAHSITNQLSAVDTTMKLEGSE